MELKAKLRNYRVSARKARLLADEIRGRGVEDALTILDLSNKRFAKPLAKLVRSALAIAEERNERDRAGIDVDNLVVDRIMVDQGASMWRVRARAQGRAAWIQRRTSHVSIVLAEH
ncbi:MAG: 50S ribosomal protein L22 [Myxococcales bacterium]|nr:50S ribosomal protein L22 [Myxococcales bacterium]MCH8889711.1 50S ribosomal protein L22 [Myxococcales bacterium]